MFQPLVFVSTDVYPLDGCIWHGSPRKYLDALIETSKTLPLLLPSLGKKIDIESLFSCIDGVLLTGSESNVCPSLYNSQERTETNGPYDQDRDETTLPLILKAVKKGVPLLAICRGIQELNVALGGTLATEIQDKEGILDHRSLYCNEKDMMFHHSISIEPDSCLSSILGISEMRVNSFHRQGLCQLAPGLQVEARAPDNVIEAVSLKDRSSFLLGLQWHPERLMDCEESKKIFTAFGDAVRAYAKVRRQY